MNFSLRQLLLWTAILILVFVGAIELFFVLCRNYGHSQTTMLAIQLAFGIAGLVLIVKRKFLLGITLVMLLLMVSAATIASPDSQTKSLLIQLVDEIPDDLGDIAEIAEYLRKQNARDDWLNPFIVETDDNQEILLKSFGNNKKADGRERNAEISIRITIDSEGKLQSERIGF